jgi:hypothetical protein
MIDCKEFGRGQHEDDNHQMLQEELLFLRQEHLLHLLRWKAEQILHFLLFVV